jgi:ATP-dependent DNA helicase RecG
LAENGAEMKYPGMESAQLEFKREPPRNDQVVKTVIGFCNQNGGKLVIGVADDASIKGIEESKVGQLLESIERTIYDSCSPLIIPRLYVQNFQNKYIIAIEVSTGMNKPYYRRAEGLEKGTYIRLGKHTVRATPEIIRELEWQSRGIDFEGTPVYTATTDDIDTEKVENFLSARRNNRLGKVSDEVLMAYGVIVYEHSKLYPTVLGVLLFGRNPQHYFTEAMIICSHFKGTSGRESIASVDCEGTLFQQFEQAYDFILSRLTYSFSIDDLKRKETLEIPAVAVREALLNTVAHRNYHIKAPTKIAIYEDRIEFFSPGQFPGPLDTNNLKKGISYLRNPRICKVLREANYIEKLGTGFITIFESYKVQGLSSPKVIEGENFVKCVLPRVISKKGEEQADDYDRIKELFLERSEIQVRDMVRSLSLSRSTVLRRLNQLIKDGVVLRLGERNSSRYKLKK